MLFCILESHLAGRTARKSLESQYNINQSKYLLIYLPDETLGSPQLLMMHKISFHLHSPPMQNHSVTKKGEINLIK